MSNLLSQTYSKYLDERKRLRAELAKIEQRILALEEAGATSNKVALPALPPPNSEDTTLTDRVFQTVNSLAAGTRKRRSEIRKLLEAAGYVPKGENFDVTLFKTLIRLHKQKKITGAKIDGVWYFTPKEVNTLEFA